MKLEALEVVELMELMEPVLEPALSETCVACKKLKNILAVQLVLRSIST